MDIMKSLFGYLGGKNRVSKQIIGYMADHQIYVEPFFGSGAVFFNKGYKEVISSSKYREVIGDLNGDITNFYEQLRSNYKVMQDKLKFFEYSEELKKKSHTKSDYYLNSDDITKACLFLFNIMMSFSGTLNLGFAYSKKGRNHLKTTENKIHSIELYAKRLKSAFIFNKSYDVLIDRFDTENTLFYLDPPYRGRATYPIQRDFPFDHDKFIENVKSIKGKFILSEYKSEWLSDKFKDFRIIEIKHKPSCLNHRLKKNEDGSCYVKEGSNECIILNYDPKDVNLWNGKEDKKIKQNEFFLFSNKSLS